jgi:chromosome segregation ATPase
MAQISTIAPDDRHPIGVVVGARDTDRYRLLEADIARAMNKVQLLGTQLTESDARCSAAEARLREKEVEIAALKSDFAALKASLPDLVMERLREALARKGSAK